MPGKGQKSSPETVAKHKETMHKTMLQKYKWELAEPYFDVELSSSTRNRSHNFITLRKFKEYTESGMSSKDIAKLTSRNLATFFSNFCQGNIQLTREQFVQDYEDGYSLEEIAEKHCVVKDYIGFLRQLYNINAKGAKFIHRKETEVPFTQRQKEILYGSMLGDAKRVSPSAVGFGHCEKQKDYLMWKYDEFKNVSSENSLKKYVSIDKRSGQPNVSYRFYTHANTDAEKCVSLFYRNQDKNGKWIKGVNQEILDMLTPLSIAVWFMDDGKSDFHRHSEKEAEHKQSPAYIICCESFLKEETELIQKWFKAKYNISARLREIELSDRTGYRIIIERESYKDFVNLIGPYILPMFMYKIDYDAFLQSRGKGLIGISMKKLFEHKMGEDFSQATMQEQEAIVQDFVNYYQQVGAFKLSPKSVNLKKYMRQLIDYDTQKLFHKDHIGFVTIGNNFVMSHFPNFLAAKAKGRLSPKDIFYNPVYLSEIIRDIILEKRFPTRRRVLSKLTSYRGNRSASGFMPCIAKAIFDKYCPNNGKVLDFCAGYGGRLAGAMSSQKVASYCGIELNKISCNNLNTLANHLRVWGKIDKEAIILHRDSIEGMKTFADQSFDFCFTSPPYFDAETYDNNLSQSSQQYPNYADWFEKFLIPAVQEARRVSKKVAINIANTGPYHIADDLEKWLIGQNIPVEKDKICYPKYGGGHKYEPIFLFPGL